MSLFAMQDPGDKEALLGGDSGMGRGGVEDREREVREGESSQPKPTAVDQPAPEWQLLTSQWV